MKVYLDACSLQRPLDNRNQIRVTLDAEAILGVLKLCETGQIELISSEALTLKLLGFKMPSGKNIPGKRFPKQSGLLALTTRLSSEPRIF
jgi:hypothetical protein